MPEPMALELYFAADPSFRRLWEGAVSDMADRVLAFQLAWERDGSPRASLAEETTEALPEGTESLDLEFGAPWPPAVVADAETVRVTFLAYVRREVQRRLDLRVP